MVNEAPKSEPGEPVFAVSVPNAAQLPAGTKRMVILQTRVSNLQVVTGINPEVAKWLGEQLIEAAKAAGSPLQVAKSIPTIGNGGVPT